MILLFTWLANYGVDDSFEDVLLWQNALHILDKLVRLVYLIVLEVVDDQVESGLGDHINQRWKHLKSVLSSSEDDQIVSQQVIILEQATWSGSILKLLELNFSSLAVVELIVIAGLQIDTDNRIRVKAQVYSQDL